MAKLIKFDLSINNTKARNLEELRTNFTIEILELYTSGILLRWLNSRDLTIEAEKLSTIPTGNNDVDTVVKLYEIFGVDAARQEIEAVLLSNQQLRKDQKDQEEQKVREEQKELNLQRELEATILALKDETKVVTDVEIASLIRCADKGDARAQYSLGECYWLGKGVEKSHEEAAKWYSLAADQGHADAQYKLTNGVVEIVMGPDFVFARKADGSWYVTGDNFYGQLGLGDTDRRSTFTLVPSLNGATLLVAGKRHTFARMADGNWYATGCNQEGEFGLRNKRDYHTFTLVSLLDEQTQVVTGGDHTFARKADGNWYATGDSGNHLGFGDLKERNTFTIVPSLNGATQLVSGYCHTFARKADGNWYATGFNDCGQLGVGIEKRGKIINTFTLAPSLNGATQVVIGGSYTFARKVDGGWYAVGENTSGQLGLEDTDDHSTFTLVPMLNGATQLVAGDYHTFARQADGNWYATGGNHCGQLGLGDTDDRSTFTLVPSLNGATQVVTRDSSTFARLADGNWYATGKNGSGQLGLGDTKERLTFTLVASLNEEKN